VSHDANLHFQPADTRPLLVLHALPLRSALRPYRAPAVRGLPNAT
jgi:hypothetical protein